MTTGTRRFINIHVWKRTKKLFKLLADLHELPLCVFMHRVAEELAQRECLSDSVQTEIQPESDQDA